MNKSKIFSLIIIINLLVIIIIIFSFLRIERNNQYMIIENYPDSIYSIEEGKMPYLFKTQNGTLFLVYSKFNWIPEEKFSGADIFLISSNNSLNWSPFIQITNDTLRNTHPVLTQQNESIFRLFYACRTSDYVRNWKYIDSQDLMNWTNPIICDKPIVSQYWSEIELPPFFEHAKENPDHYSLIKNQNGTYIFVGIRDISSSADKVKTKLFIMTSDNGKDWSLPIMISKKDCYLHLPLYNTTS